VPEAKTEKKEGTKAEEHKAEEHKSDVRIITKAVYRHNGTGYIDTKNAFAALSVHMAKVGAKPVTSVEGYCWDGFR